MTRFVRKKVLQSIDLGIDGVLAAQSLLDGRLVELGGEVGQVGVNVAGLIELDARVSGRESHVRIVSCPVTSEECIPYLREQATSYIDTNSITSWKTCKK